MRRQALVAFVGPSLPAAEARRLGRCVVLPPAGQGDVWRALEAYRPRAIALIDGLFELVPSVWHHELLDALSIGVAVFGAASMGALRAAELQRWGMVPVGKIAWQYARGLRIDDSDVALLHADEEAGFRPLTVPLVDAQHALLEARRQGALRPALSARALRAARSLHYTERTWPALARAAGLGVGPTRALLEFIRKARPSLKADDARACLVAAREFTASGAEGARTAPTRRSAFVRARRLLALGAKLDPKRSFAGPLGLLAASTVRAAGLSASPGRTQALERQLRRVGHSPLRAAQLAQWAALQERAVELSARLVPDAPCALEGAEAGGALRPVFP